MTDNTPIDIIHSRDHDGDIAPEDSSKKEHRNSVERTPATIQHDKLGDDVPPDGGYGWVCVASVFWINAHTWGINSSYGVFLAHYLTNDVFPNTSPLMYAFTGGLSISCALLIAPLATYLIHLFGTRAVLNLGVFFETLSLIGSSFVTQRWQLFLSQGVCFGFGMGFLFVGSVGITPQWFSRRRGLAMGINAAGSGLGGMMYSLAVGAIIPRLGLSWAFRILGILACVVNLVCANLLRDRNKAVGSRYKAFHLPLLKRPEFLLFLGWGVLTMLGYVAILFSLSNFATSVGLSPHQSSIISALLNLGQGLGRPFVGMFSDKLGRINIATFLTFLCGVFCLLIWTFARSMGLVSFFAVLVGTVAGTYWATVAPVLAEIIDLRDLPGGLSITWIVLVPPTTVAEPIALLLRNNRSEDYVYLHVQIFTGLMYIAAAVCLWLVRGWKVGDNIRVKQEMAAAAATGSEEKETGLVQKSERAGISDSGVHCSPVPTKKALWYPHALLRSMVAARKV
ncbi:major facilitator superfamily domain-containing protein [Aspergillus pseudoustus]|uniref:Major facilitator superfamily domain-containing protein n=1 Tax=Aspergillus pseudoustus TaxID=1810923 RepID=A0ABR4JD06_9EURO